MTFQDDIQHLVDAKSWEPGDKVRVPVSGRTGTLHSRRTPRRDGWNVLWDEPLYGVERSRVATSNLERIPS